MGQIDPKCDKYGTYISPESKCTEIWSEKSPRFVPFGANLTDFGAKLDIAGANLYDDLDPSALGKVRVWGMSLSDVLVVGGRTS